MKVRSVDFETLGRFDCQFKELNSVEMNSLRGGGEPPLPPTSGDDWVIDILNPPKKVDATFTITVLSSPALITTVDVEYKKHKKK